MNPERRKFVLFGLVAGICLVLDQITKYVVRETIKPLGYAGKPVIDDHFVLRFSENTGVAFGLLQSLPGGRIILTIVAMFALVLVVQYLRRTDPGHTRLHWGLGLVAGGALGNLTDRIALGGVTDFLVVNLGFWPLNPWPAFNVADAALVIGVGIMALDMARAPKDQAKTDDAAAVAKRG